MPSSDANYRPPRPRNNNTRAKRPNKPRGGPKRAQAQQLKVTVRRIQDVERYGTVAQVLDMIRNMVTKVNLEKTTATLPIQLDEGSMERLIQAEELAAERAAAFENAEETQEEGTNQEESTPETTANDSQKDDATTKPETTKANDSQRDDSKPPSDATKYASVVKGAESEFQGPCIRARALYVVPPKKSRRRGIKSGCAYLILTVPNTMSEEETAAMTQAERSRATAKGRLQLLTAVEALSKAAEEKADSYGGCIVQTSVCGKGWKENHRDNREDTIESTADYKHFISKSKKEAEERLARPRPTPGGSLEDLNNENGQQVAAIVLHLRAKRQQEAKRKKATMRKIVPATLKDNGGKGGKKKQPPMGEGSQRTAKRRIQREKKRENKKRGGNKNSAPTQAPVVLRAGGSASAGTNTRG